mgnify:CR=1 FL=1
MDSPLFLIPLLPLLGFLGLTLLGGLVYGELYRMIRGELIPLVDRAQGGELLQGESGNVASQVEGQVDQVPGAVALEGPDGLRNLQGVADGEHVVTQAQFMLDSESRMQEAISKFRERGRQP